MSQPEFPGGGTEDQLLAELDSLALRASEQIEALLAERAVLDERIKRLREVVRKVSPSEARVKPRRSSRTGAWAPSAITPMVLKVAEAAAGETERFTAQRLTELTGFSEGGVRGAISLLRGREYLARAGQVKRGDSNVPAMTYRVMAPEMLDQLREERDAPN